jgi:hypothetical protein
MTKCSVSFSKELLGGCVVEVNAVIVGKKKFDFSERIIDTRLLPEVVRKAFMI